MILYEQCYFSTFTIEGWIPVFQDVSETVECILNSFQFIYDNWNVEIFAFVVMVDHLHILWNIKSNEKSKITNSFKSFTSKEIIKVIKGNDEIYLQNFHSERKDRKLKIWKLKTGHYRIGCGVDFLSKFNYIHNNQLVVITKR